MIKSETRAAQMKSRCDWRIFYPTSDEKINAGYIYAFDGKKVSRERMI
jgi:hypothetical protein